MSKPRSSGVDEKKALANSTSGRVPERRPPLRIQLPLAGYSAARRKSALVPAESGAEARASVEPGGAVWGGNAPLVPGESATEARASIEPVRLFWVTWVRSEIYSRAKAPPGRLTDQS